jgi:hypothetical protein
MKTIEYTDLDLQQIIDGLNPIHINSDWDYETIMVDLAKSKLKYEKIKSEIEYYLEHGEDAEETIYSIQEILKG